MESLNRKQEAESLGFEDAGNFFKKQPINITDKVPTVSARMDKHIREAFEKFSLFKNSEKENKDHGGELVNS